MLLKIFKGNYKKNDVNDMNKNTAAVATAGTWSPNAIKIAMINHDAENISKCMIHG